MREQDEAAGGSAAREVHLPEGGRAHASVALRVFGSSRRIYAYLRWSVKGKTHERYAGEVDGPTREENLAQAWRHVQAKELIKQPHDTGAQRQARASSWASSPSSRAVMRANRGRDTRPELALRSAVHGLGLRYRVATRPIKEVRRTADLVFPRAKVAVFLDGCFWHGCPDHYRPATGDNSEFWRAKIDRNKTRDAQTDRLLRDAGWDVLRVWEHEASDHAAERVASAVHARKG